MEVALIAAMDRQRAIGFDNQLPWQLPDDLKFFKAQTQDGVVVMGRKTFESLGCRPLPNRRNIVLTRQPDWQADGVEVAADWPALRQRLEAEGLPLVWVIGGGEIYATCLPDAGVLVLTLVDTELTKADAWFPDWQTDGAWRQMSQEAHAVDARHAHAFAWTRWLRAND